MDGLLHEYEYQIKYSKKVLQSVWPDLKWEEIKNYRYLVFKTSSGKTFIIDLNTYNDPFGIFLFNAKDPPSLADMTNFDQAVYQHFKK